MKRKNKKNRLKETLILVGIFLLGAALVSYPIISNFYYEVQQADIISNFNSKKRNIDTKEVNDRINLARAYNQTLDPDRINDPYTDEEKEGVAEYARMLEINEQIGYVEIPSIDVKISIYAGTSDDVLQKGAGHLEGTSLPVGGQGSHSVITAHTGLPNAKLFSDLNKLKEGDVFYIHNIKETLAYKVDQINVVDPHDFSKVMVEDGEDLTTLLTCTPYGINSHRLLVRGYRIPYEPTEDEVVAQATNYCLYIVLGLLGLLVIGLFIFIYRRRKAKKNETK